MKTLVRSTSLVSPLTLAFAMILPSCAEPASAPDIIGGGQLETQREQAGTSNAGGTGAPVLGSDSSGGASGTTSSGGTASAAGASQYGGSSGSGAASPPSAGSSGGASAAGTDGVGDGAVSTGGVSTGGVSKGAAGSGGLSTVGKGGSTSGGASGGSASSSGGAQSKGGRSGSGGAAGSGGAIQPGNPGSSDVTFEIDAERDTHPISPLIYGVNSDCGNKNVRAGLCRLGGNRWTAYNWENNASNAGSDYCYQNDSYVSSSNVPGAAVTDELARAKSVGAATLVTIPIVDYVAADKDGGDGSCSGDVRNSGSDYLSTRFKKNQPRSGVDFPAKPNVTDGVVSQDEFVNFLKNAAGASPVLISLDNEPDLWSFTHEEIHPNAVTYAELVKRNIEFASAVRSVWADVEITGLVSYGFNGYVNLQDAPDASGKGEFLDYYLSQMKAAEASAGGRLIDYLDLHWYPEAQGGGARVTGTSTASDVVAARVQAPRSLWDSSYKEKSWLVDYVGGPLQLLPWLKEKIAKNYPGTKLAITEWNYGGGQHISGAIATADVLGIFGREDVGLANVWPLNSNESFTLAAFQMYRNYDGQGAAFGDTSIAATSSDVSKASVYASVDSANANRVVLVAINRTGGALKAGIKLSHRTSYTTANVFVLAGTSAKPSAGAGLTAVASNAFSYEMPAYSVSVIVPQQ